MRKLFSFFLLLTVMLVGSLNVAFGEMMSTVRVAQGDFFRYDYVSYFSSSDPHTEIPNDLKWINQTNYFMINVTGVSGASVNFETMYRGLNGSSVTGVCNMNVGTGMTTISGYGGPSSANSFYFMARGVGMMGRMFPSSTLSPTINDTFSMPYLGSSRLTNHFVTNENNTLLGVYNSMDIYYDQATGVMVKWRQETIQTSGATQTNSTQMMNITSSNIWVIPEFPTTAIVPILTVCVASTLLAIGITKYKRHLKLQMMQRIISSRKLADQSACVCHPYQQHTCGNHIHCSNS